MQKKLTDIYNRQMQVLKAIILQHMKSGEPVSSASISFDVSSATIRNDMADLEASWLILKPHTSAGRIPTSDGYKLFVSHFVEEQKLIVRNSAVDLTPSEHQIYKAIETLCDAADCIAFIVLPEHTYFLGISKILLQAEFQENMQKTAEFLAILEQKERFATILRELDIPATHIRIFVGLSDILPVSVEASMMTVRWHGPNSQGIVGLIGSMRMDYVQNAEYIKKALEILLQQDRATLLLDPAKQSMSEV